MSFATDAPRPYSQILSTVEQKKPQQNSYNHRIDLEEQTVLIVVVVVPIWDGRASSCLLYFIAAIHNSLTFLTNLSSSLSRPVIFVLLSSAGYTYSRVPCRKALWSSGLLHTRLDLTLQGMTADWHWPQILMGWARKAKPMGCRCEGFLRLPFVDDQCLRSAMQGFLTRAISRKARLTRRQTRSSQCSPFHCEKILPFFLPTYSYL